MEMQLFILGHVILLAISMNIAMALLNDDEPSGEGHIVPLIMQTAVLFIPLEIMYWVLHFNFVP